MKKLWVLTLALSCLFSCSSTEDTPHDPIIFTGDIVLTSAQEIANFMAAGHTVIDGNVRIAGVNLIDDLSAFAGITEITGNLHIDFTSITSMSGFENLEKTGGFILLDNNRQLKSLIGLEKLTEIGGGIGIWANHQLESLQPLSNVTDFGGIVSIQGQNELRNLRGLEGLTSEPKALSISGFFLESLEGLPKINSVEGSLRITGCGFLTDLENFRGITSIGEDLWLEALPRVEDLSIFDELTLVGGEFGIIGSGATQINSFNGLTGLESLVLLNNREVTSISGFQNLTAAKSLTISGSDELTNLSGFSNLQTVEEQIWVIDNPSLPNLDGLSAIQGNPWRVWIFDNQSLTNFCGTSALFADLPDDTQIIIRNNAFNPGLQDIKAGNCSD